MDDNVNENVADDMESKASDVTYNPEKDFYKGMSGELRFKAEGLFKKAREKGISLEDIDIDVLGRNQAEFPGIGVVELPAFIVKVKGKHLQSGQMIVDGKQIDYFNRYQRYVADRIEGKNVVRDERGKPVRENGRPKIKDDAEFLLDDRDKFQIGKDLIEDKEFGLEKTITGACDRVIRKLMGENDWLYPEEARMLDEEFISVQNAISRDQQGRRGVQQASVKKATERQISYLKAKIKNAGMDPDMEPVMREVLRQTGFEAYDVNELSTSEASRIIDSIGSVIPKVKETLARQGNMLSVNPNELPGGKDSVRQ